MKVQKADVRFLAATHRDLDAMVGEGSFRRDLFFRVNVVSLSIPPLRERPEDIPILLDMALDRFNRILGKKIRGFAPGALRLLLNHDYPGNVRELLNMVERAVILCRGQEVLPSHLPEALVGRSGSRQACRARRAECNAGGPGRSPRPSRGKPHDGRPGAGDPSSHFVALASTQQNASGRRGAKGEASLGRIACPPR